MEDDAFYLSQIPAPKSTPVRAKKISSLVSRVLTKYGVENQQASEGLQMRWRQLVGDAIADATRVGNLQRGSLFVAVDNNLVAQELHMRKREILQGLKEDPIYAGIKDLKLRIGTIR